MTNSINYHIMENTTPKLGIIESDPWLEPYSAAIEGRHQHAIDKELELTNGNQHFLTLQPVIFILVCTVLKEDGCSVNGHRMRKKSILLEISMVGKRMAIIGCIA